MRRGLAPGSQRRSLLLRGLIREPELIDWPPPAMARPPGAVTASPVLLRTATSATRCRNSQQGAAEDDPSPTKARATMETHKDKILELLKQRGDHDEAARA